MVVYVKNTINVVKKSCKIGKNTCILNVEKLTKYQKMFVLQLWPPTNVRKLTHAHVSGTWLKSRTTHKVHELSHEAWLNSRKSIIVFLAGCERKVQGESKILLVTLSICFGLLVLGHLGLLCRPIGFNIKLHFLPLHMPYLLKGAISTSSFSLFICHACFFLICGESFFLYFSCCRRFLYFFYCLDFFFFLLNRRI